MKQYLSLIQEVLDNGVKKEDRTGTGTISIFGVQRKYDLREGFPLVTTKKVLIKSLLAELLWFLKGSTTIKDLDCHIWDAWAREDGEIGPLYGYQWVKWEKYTPVDEEKGIYKKTHVNQIQNAIDLIKNDPKSRRILVSAWNVGDLEKMALYPCHAFFQFYVVEDSSRNNSPNFESRDTPRARREECGVPNAVHKRLTTKPEGMDRLSKTGSYSGSSPKGRLDCQLYQRSADIALGVPFNIASYSALLMMMARECDLEPGVFTHTIGDAHIYSNHVEGLREQLTRKPHPLPQLKIAKKPFWDLKYEDFELLDYKHEPFIKFKVAV